MPIPSTSSLSAMPVNPSGQELKDAHQKAIAILVEEFVNSDPSINTINYFLRKISNVTDQTLIDLWHSKNLPEKLALVAVGGYGRAELFPYSDVDVLILLPNEINLEKEVECRQAIESFIARSWDLGLHIGSSVRTVQECLDESMKDITTQTALLESRLISGDKALYEQFHNAFFKQMNPSEFIQAKLSEMRRRHQKFNNTPYSLEPNCKESPGGLRDLHVILWITKAAKLGSSWAELTDKELLTELEMRQVKNSESWLKLLRAHLHLQNKRHEDRLLFDVQESIAQTLNYKPSGSKRASEVLMRRYYRTAKNIAQINHIFISSITECALSHSEQGECNTISTRPINKHFVDRAGMLDIIDEQIYSKNPHEILRTFLVFAQNSSLKTLSAHTFRALHNARRLMNANFRHDPVNAQTFIQILQCEQGVYQAFKLMDQTSVLGRYLSVFRGIVGQMQHDLFHVYTVDQHTLMVLRNIRRFFLPEHVHEYPLCSEIATNFEKPWLLYIAALFHDIAKGRHGDHSKLGAKDVAHFARQHGINEADTTLIEFLVAEHLTLSHIAQKEDVSDPEVIDRFIDVVKNEYRLNALYLLTVADIRGTSPKVWNSWKAHLLEQLYQLTRHRLGGQLIQPTALVNTRKQSALKILKEQGFTFGNEAALWATLSISYFMRHTPDDIAWHTQKLWDKVGSEQPIVRVKSYKGNDGLQVLIYTPDRPDLFARICGVFSMTDLNIVDARIHTTTPAQPNSTGGWALDTFQLIPTDHLEKGIEETFNLERLEQIITRDLQKSLQQNSTLPEPRNALTLSRRARYFPLPPKIELQPDENREHWLLSITAGDRIGLLYAIARVLTLKQINVELAKITTLGDRVEDTFLISGPMLGQPQFQEELEKTLYQALTQ